VRSAERPYGSYVIKILDTDFGAVARPFHGGRWLRDVCDREGNSREDVIRKMQEALDDYDGARLATEVDDGDAAATETRH
jgi:hypothetical protein